MAEDVWILGIHMTKFGKHTDLDANAIVATSMGVLTLVSGLGAAVSIAARHGNQRAAPCRPHGGNQPPVDASGSQDPPTNHGTCLRVWHLNTRLCRSFCVPITVRLSVWPASAG